MIDKINIGIRHVEEVIIRTLALIDGGGFAVTATGTNDSACGKSPEKALETESPERSIEVLMPKIRKLCDLHVATVCRLPAHLIVKEPIPCLM